MPAGYWELTVDVSADTVEGLTNFVWEVGALGVVEEERPGAAAQLRAFFPDTMPRPALESRVRRYLGDLARLGFSVSEAAALAPLADGNWAEAWREHFRPLVVGRRLVVAPPWETPPGDGRLAVIIEPGRAFGTGHHATTAGCLELLERAVERAAPAWALDLGTGSGILAIAAARLGVGWVVAVDDDPDAIACAVANAARNAVADRVRCVLDDAGALVPDPSPLVMANLMRAAHVRLAGAYARYVAAGGMLIVSGVLDAEVDDVVGALGGEHFAIDADVSRDGWTTLALRRRAAA